MCLASTNAELEPESAIVSNREAIQMSQVLAGLLRPVQARAGTLAIVGKPLPHNVPKLMILYHLVIHHAEGSSIGFRHHTAGFEALSQLQQLVTLYCKLHLSRRFSRNHTGFLATVSVDIEKMTQLKAVYLEPTTSNLRLPTGCRWFT